MNTASVMKERINIHIVLISICILSTALVVTGQTTDSEIQAQRRAEQNSLERERKAREILSPPARNKDAEELRREGLRIRRQVEAEKAAKIFREDRREEKERLAALLAPNPEDFAKYNQFLRQPKAGLFRLFPDLDCDSKNLVRVDDDCEKAIPNSWAYSFRRKDYIPDLLDVRLKEGNLIADGFLSQTILVSLGDVLLENVSLASNGMKFLVRFKPQTPIKDARRQFKEIAKTINSDNYRYGKILRVDLNTTYAARIVAYRKADKKNARLSPYTMSLNEKKFWDLKNDKRADLIIAFRVVRKDTDGNITILWKELAHQNGPKLVFTKDEKLSDIK